ncbi:MAG: hypothetical protein R3C54_14985 [Parvularculaceae bacterium]
MGRAGHQNWPDQLWRIQDLANWLGTAKQKNDYRNQEQRYSVSERGGAPAGNLGDA